MKKNNYSLYYDKNYIVKEVLKNDKKYGRTIKKINKYNINIERKK